MRLLTVNGIAISQENPNVRSVKTEADKIMDKERLKSAAKECVKLKSISRVKKFELEVYTDVRKQHIALPSMRLACHVRHIIFSPVSKKNITTPASGGIP